MRDSRFMQSLLVINALLMTCLLWVQVSGLSFVSSVEAQDRGITFPNAAEQRKQMIDELRAMNVQIQRMHKTLEEGKYKIDINNAAEIARQFPAANGSDGGDGE